MRFGIILEKKKGIPNSILKKSKWIKILFQLLVPSEREGERGRKVERAEESDKEKNKRTKIHVLLGKFDFCFVRMIKLPS